MNFEDIERMERLESSYPVYILKITREKLKGTLEESLAVYGCKHMRLDYLKKYIFFDKKQIKKRSQDLLDKNRAEAVNFLNERIGYLEDMLNNRMKNKEGIIITSYENFTTVFKDPSELFGNASIVIEELIED